MINEVVPSDPLQDFYGIPNADYLKTTLPLLQGAGTEVNSILGGNILIEKSKVTMAIEDIAAMLEIIK